MTVTSKFKVFKFNVTEINDINVMCMESYWNDDCLVWIITPTGEKRLVPVRDLQKAITNCTNS